MCMCICYEGKGVFDCSGNFYSFFFIVDCVDVVIGYEGGVVEIFVVIKDFFFFMVSIYVCGYLFYVYYYVFIMVMNVFVCLLLWNIFFCY